MSREVGGTPKEGKEPMKGKISELRGTCGKDRFIDADEPIVVPSKEGEVSESGFRVTDDAPNLECAWLRGQGRLAEIVKDRAAERTEDGESCHQRGDARSLMWCS